MKDTIRITKLVAPLLLILVLHDKRDDRKGGSLIESTTKCAGGVRKRSESGTFDFQE